MGVVFTQSPPQRALEATAGPQLGCHGQSQSSGALEAPGVLHLPGSRCNGRGPGVTGPSGPGDGPAVSPRPAAVHSAASPGTTHVCPGPLPQSTQPHGRPHATLLRSSTLKRSHSYVADTGINHRPVPAVAGAPFSFRSGLSATPVPVCGPAAPAWAGAVICWRLSQRLPCRRWVAEGRARPQCRMLPSSTLPSPISPPAPGLWAFARDAPVPEASSPGSALPHGKPATAS